MFRTLRPLICLTLVSFAARGSEWDDLKAQYEQCTVIAGLGAGNGTNDPNEWNNAEGLPATTAELSEPHSAMADVYGRIYAADKNAHAIRRIDTDGTIHTVAGRNLNEMSGATTNAGFDGDGPARQRLLDGPQHAYVLPDGTFYILDSGNRRIRRVDTNGMMTTVITESAPINRGLWVRRDGGLIYYCTDSSLRRWTPTQGNGPGTAIARGFVEAGNIDIDPLGHIFVTDRGSSAVYRVPFNHDGSTVTAAMIVAGTANDEDSGNGSSGEPATEVGMLEVRGIAFHPLGGYLLATHAGGDIWYVDGDDGEAHLFIQGNSADVNDSSFPVPANDESEISEPRSVSVTLAGDILIASNDAGFIRVVRNVLPRPAPPAWESIAFAPAAGMRLRWHSVPENWYVLDRSANLAPNSWSRVAMLPAAGFLTEFTDPPATPPGRRFYRLHAFRGWPN